MYAWVICHLSPPLYHFVWFSRKYFSRNRILRLIRKIYSPRNISALRYCWFMCLCPRVSCSYLCLVFSSLVYLLFCTSFKACLGSFLHSVEEKAESIPRTNQNLTREACKHTSQTGTLNNTHWILVLIMYVVDKPPPVNFQFVCNPRGLSTHRWGAD